MRINPTFIGHLAYYFAKLIRTSLKLKVQYHSNAVPKKQYIFCFWHDKQFAPVMFLDKLGIEKQAAFVSASRDGEILATWLKKMHYDVVRGSSNRKAISGMVHMIKKAKQGFTIGVAADGPRGPRYEAKAGAAFVALKSDIELVPLGVAYSSKWVVKKAWDKYQLPKAFSNVALYFGEPIKVTKDWLSEEGSLLIKSVIDRADMHALEMLSEK
jgi:lysophospholipid acyltransferase (LPLAT)-like uncharacterized protein